MARSGAEVVINYGHDAAGAQASAAKAIENDGGKAIVIEADVSKPDDIKSLFNVDSSDRSISIDIRRA